MSGEFVKFFSRVWIIVASGMLVACVPSDANPYAATATLYESLHNPLATALTKREVFMGVVWGKHYRIEGSPAGGFYIKVGATPQERLIASESIRKTYEGHTASFAVDAYLAPTHACPYRYLLVIGSAAHTILDTMDCNIKISFLRSTNGAVYGTESWTNKRTPVRAYEITQYGTSQAEPLFLMPSDPEYTKYLSFVEVYGGHAWNTYYTIIKPVADTYYLQFYGSTEWTRISNVDTIKREYHGRSHLLTLDAYRIQSQGCHDQYFLIIGSKRHKRTYLLDCHVPLTFQAGHGNNMYATEDVGTVTAETPVYRITAASIAKPEPLLVFPDYPGYEQYVVAHYQSKTTTPRTSFVPDLPKPSPTVTLHDVPLQELKIAKPVIDLVGPSSRCCSL